MQNRFLEHISTLKTNGPSLQQALAAFSSPKEHTVQNFQEGIRQFVRLANMPPAERAEFYGSRFAGLYNNNHLAELWNEDCPVEDEIAPHSIDHLMPASWEIAVEEECFALRYLGSQLTVALDQLVKGPSVIDCGMFSQLGIWFGIRYILGDDAFNEQFINKPFFLTSYNYFDAIEGKEAAGNPLFAFFSPDILGSVTIEHVFNHPDYLIKHPGGNLAGENVLIINHTYYIFAPLQAKTQWTREEVYHVLLDAFNAEPDAHDSDTLAMFPTHQAFFESQYGSIYELTGATISWVHTLINNPILLRDYASILYSLPACKEKMEAIFGRPGQDCKTSFLRSFSTIGSNRKKFEAFYAFPYAKGAFEFLLAKNSTLSNEYYQNILSVFTSKHESMADYAISATEFADMPKQDRPDLPSCIHFNLDKFLHSLQHKRALAPSAAGEESRGSGLKKVKVDAMPSQVQTTFFAETREASIISEVSSSGGMRLGSSDSQA